MADAEQIRNEIVLAAKLAGQQTNVREIYRAATCTRMRVVVRYYHVHMYVHYITTLGTQYWTIYPYNNRRALKLLVHYSRRSSPTDLATIRSIYFIVYE